MICGWVIRLDLAIGFRGLGNRNVDGLERDDCAGFCSLGAVGNEDKHGKSWSVESETGILQTGYSVDQ